MNALGKFWRRGNGLTTFGLAAVCAFGSVVSMAAPASGAALKGAHVSQVIQDVKLFAPNTAPRTASVNDPVMQGMAVRTGMQSRAELTFTDLTITRLGENTVFNYRADAREVDLTKGSVLVEVPPKGAPARISTAAVTAAVTGGTALFATGPPTKFMVLEGTGTFYPAGHPDEAVSLHGGEMVMLSADGHIIGPMTFDVKTVMATSHLIVDFPDLANLPLILAVIDLQQSEFAGGNPGLPPQKDLVDVTDQVVSSGALPTPTPTPSPTSTPSPTPTPSPSATPSKSGPPSTITSPNPYVITSGTTITTDPAITTNGMTDYGTIYRGPTMDGPFTLWAFGSTSAFDTALNLDTELFADPNNLPIAFFKFQSLLLNGNPTIDTSNGGVTGLGLIGVDGITTGPPGGTLTFAGLEALYLGTVNGSIDFTSDVSFQNLSLLAVYARGAGSDLTVDSPISNIGDLKLAAENSIQLTNPGAMSVGEFDATAGNDLTLQIGGSLSLNGSVKLDTLVLPGTTLSSGANLTVNVTGDYTNSSPTDFSRLRVTNEGDIANGGNISADITGNLTATGLGSATEFPEPGDVELLVQNTGAQIDNGGNLNLTVGGSVNVNGLAVYVQNYDETANPAGHIGTGGNIDVEINGDLTASSYVDAFLNNRGGGIIDSGGNLTFNVAGALTIGADAGGIGLDGFSSEFIISSRFDDFGGNTSPSSIGSSATMFLHAASVDMAGDLFGTGISDRGSSLNGDATATWDITGDLTIRGTGGTNQNPEYWFILNDCPVGSQSQNLNVGGGTIDGNATLTLNVGGNVNIAGDALFEIENQRDSGFTAPNAGLIVGNATLNINAANFSVGGELDVDINNGNYGVGNGSGGSIEGSAAINVNVTGNLAMPGTDANSYGFPDAFFSIFNYRTASAGGTAGFIGSDASIMIQAGSIGSTSTPVDEIDADIFNVNGGTINGNATVQLGATENVTTNFLFGEIDNASASGGTINGNALVNVNAGGDVTAASVFQADIFNFNGGMINGNATVQLGATGNVTTNSFLGALLTNFNGGVIDGDASVAIQAGSIGSALTPVDSFNVYIENDSGGTINGNAIVQLGTTGNLNANSLLVQIDNSSGTIGGDATINMNVGGTATVTNDAYVQILGNDPTGSAAINFNGGSYSAGGTFLNTIDGNGSITFSNTDVHADVLKVGVFGNNGTLTIGGGTLSGDSELKFYAPGSNGFIHFVSNVTLNGSSTAAIIAANTVTIDNGVTVTIGGPAAMVFTNVPNYAALDAMGNPEGGNGSTTGRFGGSGASTSPLSSAPPFGPATGSATVATPSANSAGPTVPSASVASLSTNIGGSGGKNFSSRIAGLGEQNSSVAKTANSTITVNNSGELLSLLDAAAPGADGKIAIAASESSDKPGNSTHGNPGDGVRTNRRAATARRMRDRAMIESVGDAAGSGRGKSSQLAATSPRLGL
jgi:FecR protein